MPADSVSRSNSSNGSANDSNVSDNGDMSSRSRTSSEGSDNVARFVLPSMDGSPPKVLTMNDISSVMKNLQNMELAHEIALNPEFKLQPYEAPENSLERRVKETMHQAFWDLLREQLEMDPPRYDYAIRLLGDIKECFPQILAPNNKRALEHINEVLDEVLIRQQAENGVLDFRSYANFVINILKKSCAPARDDAIKAVESKDDVVEVFRGILEIMALMKLDMANYLLDFARNDIMAHSVEYEKQKFREYLEYYKFGFPATEKWLHRNRSLGSNNEPIPAPQAVYNAYLELVDWDESEEFPEILSTDKARILKLCTQVKRLRASASLISICAGLPIISQRPANRSVLARELEILLQEATNDTEISKLIEENVWEHIKKSINAFLQKEDQPMMDMAAEQAMLAQIQQISKPDNPVRTLMWKRLQTYIRFVLRSKTDMPPPPPGFVDYKDSLETLATAFKRVIAYNHAVFGEYFMQLLSKVQNRDQTDSRSANTTPTPTDTAAAAEC